MVASQSLQGRQSLQVRPRLPLQIAAATSRPCRLHSTSGKELVPAPLHREVLLSDRPSFGSLVAWAAHRLSIHQERASAYVLDTKPSRRSRGQQPSQLAAERLASLRCSSGENVSTSDSQNEPDETKHAHERNTSWTRMVLAAPLELAAVNSRTDNFYLRKRKRKQWWSLGHFPKVQLSGCTSHCTCSLQQQLKLPYLST